MMVIFATFILVFTVVAIHIENIIFLGMSGAQEYFQFPQLIWPFGAAHGRGFSIGAVVAAGMGAWVSTLFYEKFIYKKWGLVTEEECRLVLNKKNK